MDNDNSYFFDNPKNIKRLLNAFYAVCVLLVVLDFVIHRHVIHSWESLFSFYPLYGFVSCVLLVFLAIGLRKLIMRSEDYYDDEDLDKETNLNIPSEPSKERSKTINSLGHSHVDD